MKLLCANSAVSWLSLKWRITLSFLTLTLFSITLAYLKPPRETDKGDELMSNAAKALDRITQYVPSEWHFKGGFWLPFKTWPGSKPDVEEYVAICVATRDQHEDLKEWLSHHYHHLGIRRFYIIDHASSPPTSTFDDWPIPRSAMTFHNFPDPRSFAPVDQQMGIYNWCNEQYKENHTWIGYIDVDEFLEIIESPGQSMAEFLREYEHAGYGALGINWAIHNSNGLLKRPKSVRQSFTSCIADEKDDNYHTQHVKSFVQTKYYATSETPHDFWLSDDKVTVGEHGDTFSYAWRKPVTRNKIALHHYAVKSKEEMSAKIERWHGRDWNFWDQVEGYPNWTCNSLASYSP